MNGIGGRTQSLPGPLRRTARWLVVLAFAAGLTPEQGPNPVLGRYDFSRGAGSSVELAGVLQEISGLASTPDGRLFAHNDEQANIFQLDPGTGEIVKAFSVGIGGVGGDFEGMAIVGERFFLVTSDGTLLEFREGEARSTVPYRSHRLNLGNACEMEGLAVDPGTGTLLLPCKTPRSSRLKDHLVVLSVGLTSMRVDTVPRVAIRLEELEARGLDDKFHPSAIEVHPETGALILVAAREESMVELSSAGEILATQELKRKDHPQPEGLAFLPDGSLILADEGQGKRGTITRYVPRGGEQR